MHIKQRIAPCLWFDDQAEEAASFYVSVFKNSQITSSRATRTPGRRSTRGRRDR